MAFRPSPALLSPLRLPLASSSRSAGLLRPAAAAAVSSPASRVGQRTAYTMVRDPKKDIYVGKKLANPLSAFEYDPNPPYTPLFPIYTPLSSLDPAVPPSVAGESLVPLPRDIFGLPLRRDILHACVMHHVNLLKRRTTHTKNRAEVRGSGRKLHQQKGTGRARVADSGSGIRVGGGKIHGPRYKDYSTDLPRATRQLGFKIALSQKLREGRLKLVGPDGFVLAGWDGAGKKKAVEQQFDALALRRPLLLHSPFAPPPATGLARAIRTLPTATMSSISSVSVLDILRAHDVVLDHEGLTWLVGKIRETRHARVRDTFSGNAMVMRRRKLGLSDFPAEGEQDESKELLRLLEQETGLAEGAEQAEDAAPTVAELEAGLFGEQEAEVEAEERSEAELAEEEEDAERILQNLEQGLEKSKP